MNETKTAIAIDPIFLLHDQPGHPENAKRLEAILSGLKRNELFDQLIKIKSRSATKDEISICHTREYVEQVKVLSESGGGYLDPDTYANQYSFNAAATAVGSSIDLTKAVIKSELKNGFALLRPPGHHALSNRAMGFCLFGNIAIAAKVALTQPGISKVAIVDFDVHHGNGTQALVGDDPNILFISTHQYPFYPGTGSVNEIGSGEAKGTVINIPLPPGVGDEGFKIVYEEIVFPSLKRFKPNLILVSAGFDAHRDDPLANLNLNLTGFNQISRQLVTLSDEICSGKIVFFLEGGYNVNVLSNGVSNIIKRLMEIDSFDDPFYKGEIREPDISKLIKTLKENHNL